jgi:hypothetical protein
MDSLKVEPDADIEMHSLCDMKDEEAQGYSSVKSEGKTEWHRIIDPNFHVI